MPLENRPYVGTWRMGRQKVVQHTPDALVYINGDVSVPGCPTCNKKINIQEFLTEVSVDFGVEPGSCSGSFTLSVPTHHNNTLARDAQFVFRPGLEVHFYFRGYFPVAGMYSKGDTNAEFKDIFAYPYYPAFHGVVTQVGHSYSGGVQTISVQCGSMLHFWQFQQVSTNASIFGPRARNSHLQSSLVGHNYSGKHPYEIIWHLHNDFVSAAAGVGFALSQKTNQTASWGSESFMSISARYWEERFKSRFIKLRMHGASGQLFNAAQAAYFGRASSSELMAEFKARFNPKQGASKVGAILSTGPAAKGSTTPNASDAIRVYNPGGEAGMDLTLVDMKAFVSDLSQWGQPNLFESTYESKLDIANKVCEVTGFEFYQDVDGDFVFKPPMWNLDTSGSRVYRIEDVDIININFDEKEPQATYITAKSGQFKNLVVGGMDNEWGVQGQYIDWRLVAQYGWRPHDFETAYFNNRTAMFFAAMNRLDVVNAACKSASVTIPIRPEIRPGYPVYIPYLDCFYYVQGFSHSFSFGGQCTTNLQLVAKRAKFFAPKIPSKSGLDAIDLTDLMQPPGPLTIADSNGRPALAGFPNVVMALDPEGFDPRLLMLGGDVYDLDAKRLGGIIKVALDKGIISHVPGAKGGPNYIFPQGEGGAEDVVIVWDSEFDPEREGDAGEIPAGIKYNISLDPQELTAKQDSLKAQKDNLQKEKDKLEKILAEQEKKLEGVTDDDARTMLLLEIEKTNAGIAALDAQALNIMSDFEKEMSTPGGEPSNIKVLWKLIHSVISKSFPGGRIDLASTSFLLGILADKKASISTATLPGAYRYYSASHPKREWQGVRPATIDARSGKTEIKLGMASLDAPVTVTGFVRAAGQQLPGNWKPDAQLADVTVENGILVLDGNPKKPDGVMYPTSEIRELMFSPVRLTLDAMQGAAASQVSPTAPPENLWRAVQAGATTIAGTNGAEGNTVADVFDSWVAQVNTLFQNAADAAKAQAPSAPDFDVIEPLKAVPFNGTMVPSDKNPRAVEPTPYDVDSYSETELWAAVAKEYAAALWRGTIGPALAKWHRELVGTSQSSMASLKTSFLFYGVLSAGFNIQAPPPGNVKTAVKTNAKAVKPARKAGGRKGGIDLTAHSPVFPVSDGHGYEVVGSLRYGRDVDADVGGVWSQLVNRNPMEALDSKSVDDIVNGAYLSRKGLSGDRIRQLLLNVLDQFPGTTIHSGNDILDRKTIQTTADVNQLTNGLANWYQDVAKDAVTKIQLVNAAYALADLAPWGGSGAPCSCRTAEANIVLEDAQNASFIPVVEGMTVAPDADAVTQYVAKATATAGMEWKVRQDALRGTVLDRTPSDIVSYAGSLDEEYAQKRREADAAAVDFARDAEKAAKEAAENVRRGGNERPEMPEE